MLQKPQRFDRWLLGSCSIMVEGIIKVSNVLIERGVKSLEEYLSSATKLTRLKSPILFSELCLGLSCQDEVVS